MNKFSWKEFTNCYSASQRSPIFPRVFLNSNILEPLPFYRAYEKRAKVQRQRKAHLNSDAEWIEGKINLKTLLLSSHSRKECAYRLMEHAKES